MKQVLNTTRNQRGAALVEMALILPVLSIMFLGIVQFGLVLRQHQIVQNAAREGARFSMLPQYSLSSWDGTGTSPDTAIKNYVVQYLGQENVTITTSNVTLNQSYTVSLPDSACAVPPCKANASQVTVSFTQSPIVGGSLFGSFTYTGMAVFRNLY
jgi:Flp pilus assembly protein TadG